MMLCKHTLDWMVDNVSGFSNQTASLRFTSALNFDVFLCLNTILLNFKVKAITYIL